MHVITLVLAIIAAVLFLIDSSGRVTRADGRRSFAWGLTALGLFFLTVAFICAWTLRGDDLIYFIE